MPRRAGHRLSAAGRADARRVCRETGVDAVGVDTRHDPALAAAWCRRRVALQGNLDPLALVAGGAAMATEAHAILAAMRGRPFMFNLGHGIVPQTPLEHVAELMELVRAGLDAAARRDRAVQPRRPGPAGGDPAVPAQPVPRPGDPAGAVLRPSVPGPADRRRPAGSGHGQLRPAGRPLAVAGADPAAGAGACRRHCRNWTRNASSRCATGIRSARSGARGEGSGTRTRSFCCRCIRNISTTTTGSSLTAWREAAAQGRFGRAGHHAVLLSRRDRPMSPPPPPCCNGPGTAARAAARSAAALRVLFSAHGLPEAIVQAGDPYQWQIEQTVAAVLQRGTASRSDWTDLLPVARHAAEMAGAESPSRRSSGPRMTTSPCWSCRSPSSRNIPRRWWNWTSIIASLRNAWRPGLFPGADAERRCRLHRRIGQLWCGSARAARSGPVQPRRRPHLSRRHFGACPWLTPCGTLRAKTSTTAACDLRLRRRADRQRTRRQSRRRGRTDAPGLAHDHGGKLRAIPRPGHRSDGAADRGGAAASASGTMDRHDAGADRRRLCRTTRQWCAGAREALAAVTALGLPWRVASNSSHAEMAAKFGRNGLLPTVVADGCTASRRAVRQAGAGPVPCRGGGRGRAARRVPGDRGFGARRARRHRRRHGLPGFRAGWRRRRAGRRRCGSVSQHVRAAGSAAQPLMPA